MRKLDLSPESTRDLRPLESDPERVEDKPTATKPRPLLSATFALCLLFALTLFVFRRQLFEHWSFPWDFLGTYTTTPPFVADTFGIGHPVSWSPFVASGFPVDTDPQAGVYFPGWWLIGLLRIPLTLRALTTVQVAHVLFGCTGMLALARARRLPWAWATLAAVAYLFFGGFYGQAEHADIFRGFAYLPWLLWSLTPPEETGSWARLVALPPIAWLIVSGAYPGETVAFAIAGFVYLSVGLRVAGSTVWRRYRYALILAIVASAAVCVAVLLPYVRADQAGELYRTVEPTAVVRAKFAFSPLDILGSYLSNFAWTYQGTITAWAVGVPILVGLACARRATLKAHSPLIACGVVAVVLATTPRIGFIGRAMASVQPLFPSRFPASDYKAIVAIALIVMSADAWGRLADSRRRRPYRSLTAVCCALVLGALLAPSTYGPATHHLALLILVVLATGALALIRPPMRVLLTGLLVLVVIDGVREIYDYRLGGVVSPWQVPPAALTAYQARNVYVRTLTTRLDQSPQSRPARVPAAPTAEGNASGWVADAYHETDYDPTLERVLWEAENNPTWSSLLLAPWHGYTFSCAAVGCTGKAVHLPAPQTWRPSTLVRTLSYGINGIVYSVNVSRPTLMVENELAIDGWRSNTARVHLVSAGIPLRAWRLSPGNYRFTSTFQEPGRVPQELAAIIAIATWLGCILVFRRKPVAI
jgi:hypothetical protein